MANKHKSIRILLIGIITFLLLITLSLLCFSNWQKTQKTTQTTIKSSQSSFFSSSISKSQSSPNNNIESNSLSSSQKSITQKSIQNFTGLEFKNLYNNYNYQFVGPVANQAVVFEDSSADSYIAKKAEARGYIRRAQAEESRLEIVENAQRLQPEAKQAFLDLKNNALQSGINLTLVSGYRSVGDQKAIFLARFGNQNPNLITNGSLDPQLETVFNTTSVPGYSRHHTGYTFDLGCNSVELTTFKNTPCYAWLSANNYNQAKIVGLIPSYPEGAESQGPEPEEWEYVWVGLDSLMK